jgi:transcriptional regulator with XRE-family HTH domain
MFSAARIVALRKSRGWSQEALAEQSGVSLRTIQRVEQGDTVPRGHTVQALAAALGVTLDALQEPPVTAAVVAPIAPPAAEAHPAATLPSDPDFLQLLNLSALSFLVLPLLNLVVPWWLWRTRRRRFAHVAEVGRRILGFQVLWQVGSFFLFLLALTAQLVLFRRYHVAVPELWLGVLLLTYGANVGTIVYYGSQLRQGRLDVYRYRL